MALTPRRHLFGRSSGDWTTTLDSDNHYVAAGNVTLWLWDSASAGSRVTDLQDAQSNPITEVITSAAGTVPAFYGPVGTTRLWAAEAGDTTGDRVLLLPVDFDVDVQNLDAEIDNIEVSAGVQTVNGVAPVGGEVTLAPTDLVPAAATEDDLAAVSDIFVGRVVQTAAGWPPRPNAPVVIWQTPPDVTPITPSGALAGDMWARPVS